MHPRRRTSTPTRLVAALLALLTLTLGAVPQALADDAERLAELEQKAATAYEGKDYLTAIDLLVEANQLSPHPNYLLNIAVSYSKLGRCVEAREWATRAIKSDKPALPPEGLKVAQQVVDGCQEIKSPPDDKKDPDQAKKDPDPTQKDPAAPDHTLTITGWSLVGVGAGLFVGGLLWDQSIAADIEDYNKLPNAQRTQAGADELTSDRGTMLLVTVLGGVLGVAGGSVLLYDSLGDAEPAPSAAPGASVRLTPALTPEGAGLLLDARF